MGRGRQAGLAQETTPRRNVAFQGEAMSEYRCRKTPTPPVIDGRLSGEVWDLAEPISLALAETGGPPRQETQVRLLYDDAYLYVAFHSVDDDAWGTLVNRDDPVCSEEAVEIFIEPRVGRDVHSYIEIEVSPLNTIYDLYVLNDPRCDVGIRFLEDWDCQGLRTATYVRGDLATHAGTDEYWNCEMAIPFSEMFAAPNIPPKPGDRWRVGIYRIDRNWSARNDARAVGGVRPGDEFTSWQRVDRIDFHQPDKFGDLVFLAEGRNGSGNASH